MKPGVAIVERAFQLARTGQYRTVEGIVRALSAEGYMVGALAGPSLRKQLNKLLKESGGNILPPGEAESQWAS